MRFSNSTGSVPRIRPSGLTILRRVGRTVPVCYTVRVPRAYPERKCKRETTEAHGGDSAGSRPSAGRGIPSSGDAIFRDVLFSNFSAPSETCGGAIMLHLGRDHALLWGRKRKKKTRVCAVQRLESDPKFDQTPSLDSERIDFTATYINIL